MVTHLLSVDGVKQVPADNPLRAAEETSPLGVTSN